MLMQLKAGLQGWVEAPHSSVSGTEEESGDVHMNGDKGCKIRCRGANSGAWGNRGIAFSIKIKAHRTVPSQKCLIGP